MTENTSPQIPATGYRIDESGIVHPEEGSGATTMPGRHRGPSTDPRTAEARDAVRRFPTSRESYADESPREAPLPRVAPVLVAPKLPDNLAHRLTDNDVQAFGSAARRIGLSDQQAQAILNIYADRVKANAEQNRRPVYGETVAALQADWGEGFPRKIAYANRAVEALGGSRLREHLARTGLTNDEQLVRVFAELGERMARDEIQRARVRRGASLDRETVRLEYDRIMKDPEHPYWVRNHPDHRNAVREMERLSGLVYGTAKLQDPGVETTMPPTAPLSRDQTVNAARASAMLDEWYSDPKHPVNLRHHPQHKEAVRHAQRLQAVALRKKTADPRQLADGLFHTARRRR